MLIHATIYIPWLHGKGAKSLIYIALVGRHREEDLHPF